MLTRLMILSSVYPMFVQARWPCAGLLALAAGALGFAWLQRSTTAATVADAVILLVGWLIQPWRAFDPSVYENPLYAASLEWWRIVSVVWVLLVLAGLASLIALIQFRRL